MTINEMKLLISGEMKRKGMGQKDLGLLLGVSPRTIRKWLTGKCRVEEYMDMCEVLGLSVMVCGPVNEILVKGYFTVTSK